MGEKVTAFQAFQSHFSVLAKIGYFKLVPKPISKFKQKAHLTYRVFVWIGLITYNLQHVIKVIQVRHDSDEVINTLFILLTTFSTLCKQLAFNLRSRRTDEILNIINSPTFAPRNQYHKQVMKTNAETMRKIHRFYLSCAVTCGILWTIFPLVNRALGQKVEFPGYIPFDTSDSPLFECAVAYMNIGITFEALGNVTMDCLIVAFYAQAKVQLQILRYNLENIASFDDENDIFTQDVVGDTLKYDKDERKETYLQQKFIQCVNRHRLIIAFMKEVESIFAEALTVQFLVTAWVICMTLYKIVGLSVLSAEFASMSMYLACMLAQFFIYCYYGTQVVYESEFVPQSVYCSAWPSFSPRFRRQLLFFMINCKRPITPHTAYIVPISVETYIAVLRASYTLFTVLDRK